MNNNLDPNNKTICSYLWSSLCIRTNNRVQPCCIFDDYYPIAQLHNYSFNVQDAYNCESMRTMREKALKGEENPGCHKCYFREKETGKSLRRRANLEWSESNQGSTTSLEQITYLELFLGNQCNLKCLMCAPELSLPLALDYIKLGLSPESFKEIQENNYLDLLKKVPNLRRIKFVGGEPLIIKSHWELLNSIPEDRAKNIILEYATNCTVFPTEEQQEIWSRFEGIEVFLSVDGFQAVNEYIRFPSRWDVVERNTKKFFEFLKPNHLNIFGLNTSVTVYNVFYLDRLTEWAQEQFGNVVDRYDNNAFFVTPTTDPHYMGIQHIPRAIKEELLSKYPATEHYANVRATLKVEGDPSQLPILEKRTLDFDRIRKISYLDYVPEVRRIFEVRDV